MEKISEVLALIDANGGDENLVGIQFDNSIFVYFDTEDTKFDRSKNLESVGGVDYIVQEQMMYSKPNGKLDIPMKEYHPVDLAQAWLFIKDAQKRPWMQTSRFLMENYNG